MKKFLSILITCMVLFSSAMAEDYFTFVEIGPFEFVLPIVFQLVDKNTDPIELSYTNWNPNIEDGFDFVFFELGQKELDAISTLDTSFEDSAPILDQFQEDIIGIRPQSYVLSNGCYHAISEIAGSKINFDGYYCYLVTTFTPKGALFSFAISDSRTTAYELQLSIPMFVSYK